MTMLIFINAIRTHMLQREKTESLVYLQGHETSLHLTKLC